MLPTHEDLPDLVACPGVGIVGKELYVGGYPSMAIDEDGTWFVSNYFHYGKYGPVQHVEEIKEGENKGMGFIAYSVETSQGQSGAPL